MSTKNIIKLADKFERKYYFVKEANETTEESERMRSSLVSKFPEIMRKLKEDRAGVTLYISPDGMEYQLDRIRWGQTVPNDIKPPYETQFRTKFIEYLNKYFRGQFAAGPWDFTIPPKG